MFGFHKKSNNNSVVAPVAGKCIRIEEVEDQVFSTKVMGDGFGVIPTGNTVAAPMDGLLVTIAETKHAFGLKTNSGIEILVHIGLDTVELNGQGFEILRKQGSQVKAGEPVIRFDKPFMEGKEINLTTIVIFTAGYEKKLLLDSYYGKEVEAGQELIGE